MHCQQKPKFQNSPNIRSAVELLVNDIETYENRLSKGHLDIFGGHMTHIVWLIRYGFKLGQIFSPFPEKSQQLMAAAK